MADKAIEHLLLADGNSLSLAKQAVVGFILDKNSDEVLLSQSYANLEELPTLMKEVMIAMSKQLVEGNKRKREE